MLGMADLDILIGQVGLNKQVGLYKVVEEVTRYDTLVVYWDKPIGRLVMLDVPVDDLG